MIKTLTTLPENPLGSPENRAQYEYKVAKHCILPMLFKWGISVDEKFKVLDVGCGTGGVAIACALHGARTVALDIKVERVLLAKTMARQKRTAVDFLVADVLEMKELQERFSLIVLSEVAEHLITRENVKKVLAWCRHHLSTGGRIYVSFPPWFNPFGGHQAGWSRIRYVPWYHLLPDSLKTAIVPSEAPRYAEFIRELNHLTIAVFEEAVRDAGLSICERDLYHLRPEYRWRYGVPPVTIVPGVAKLPFFREIVVMGAYYLLASKHTRSNRIADATCDGSDPF